MSSSALDKPRSPLGALADLARQFMLSSDAAAMVHTALEQLGTLAQYDHAWLEVVQLDPAAPTLFRITPSMVEAVPPTGLLVDEHCLVLSIAAGTREIGRLRVIPAYERFTVEETYALEALAGYLGIALRLAMIDTTAKAVGESAAGRKSAQGAASEPARQRPARAASVKAELSHLLSGQLGVSILCDRVLERLLSVLDIEAGAMFVIDGRNGELQRMAQRGAPGPLPAHVIIDRSAPTMLGRAAAGFVANRIDDLTGMELASGEDELLRTWGFRSVLCFPLVNERRVIGGLMLMSRRSGAVGDHVRMLVAELADEMVLALQNALAYERLSTMTVTDSLTGLHNRRFCEEFARKQLLVAQRSHRNCALLLVDVDRMEEFNSQFGHDAGDAALRGVAASLLGSIRAADLAGRYGGEEFIVVLPNADLATAMSVAERIRHGVSQTTIPVEGRREPVTVSIGVTGFPECAETLSQFFNTADVALFTAKGAGRDRISVAPPAAKDTEKI